MFFIFRDKLGKLFFKVKKLCKFGMNRVIEIIGFW